MNLRMLYHDEPVMEMTILSNPADIIVTSWEVINPTLLPEGLKPAFDKTKDHNMQMVALTQWMNQRAIPNYRINLDDCILSLHHLPRHLFGRMHRYQHTAALLSHFASGFDDYIITPKTVENLCYAPSICTDCFPSQTATCRKENDNLFVRLTAVLGNVSMSGCPINSAFRPFPSPFHQKSLLGGSAERMVCC